MIVFNKEMSVLVVPQGLGNISESGIPSGDYNEGYSDGKAAQKMEDDSRLKDIAIKANGSYTADYGFKKVSVNVPTPSMPKIETVKTVKVEETSQTVLPSYGYDAMGKVELDADALYEKAKAEQSEEDSKKLEAIDITENGTYNADYGYHSVNVNVPTGGNVEDERFAMGYDFNADNDYTVSFTPNDGYDSMKKITIDASDAFETTYKDGLAQGEENAKGKMTSLDVVSNGSYSSEDGYHSVNVNVPTGGKVEVLASGVMTEENQKFTPSEGFDSMEEIDIDASGLVSSAKATQKAEDEGKLTEITISSNGVYNAPYGFKKATVNVPTVGGNVEEEKVTEGNSFSPLNDFTVSFTPDEGYDSMKKITIDASKAFDETYVNGMNYVKSGMKELEVTENGEYADGNGYKKVTVNVPTGGNVEEEKITNGDAFNSDNNYTVSFVPDEGYDSMRKVTIDASSAFTATYDNGYKDATASLTELVVTENGEYTDGNGYSKVTVNVPSGAPDELGPATHINPPNSDWGISSANFRFINPIDSTSDITDILMLSDGATSWDITVKKSGSSIKIYNNSSLMASISVKNLPMTEIDFYAVGDDDSAEYISMEVKSFEGRILRILRPYFWRNKMSYSLSGRAQADVDVTMGPIQLD